MLELSRRDALALVARRRKRREQSPGAEHLATPRHLHATLVTPTFVGIAWSNVPHPHAHSHPHLQGLVYDVFRDGRLIATAHHHPLFNDHGAKPQRTYRYRVRARVGRIHGSKSRQLTVKTPAAPVIRTTTASPTPPTLPALPTSPTLPTSPAPHTSPTSTTPATILSTAMVDRLFWRAGFGPSAADREQWAGQPVEALVEHFLSAPYELAPTSTPPTY